MVNFSDKKIHFIAGLLGLLLLMDWVLSFGQAPSNRLSIVDSNSNLLKNDAAVSFLRTDSSTCADSLQHILLHEDSIIIAANFIAKASDGNFLVPGYYYPNRGVYYKMPYLIKCTAKGNILWSKSYPSRGTYPSSWFTATRISELHNGDLLMVGEIGVPGTDDRRELAVWRLDKDGNQIWSESYESSLWTNPITGSTEVTGIGEDPEGNIFLSGNLRFFESSRFSFLLKINSKGIVLWDKNYSTGNPLVFGLLLIQNKLMLIGSSGPFFISPNLNSNLLWCININPGNGDTISTKAWYADFDKRSFENSFAYANTSLALLNNGQISVFGTANSDFLAFVGQIADTIRHAIVANFTPDFDFLTGIMLGSKHSTNYYNTVTTQHPGGRISFTRFSENHNLYNEDIIYGNIENNQVKRERIYHEKNRSSAAVSNFVFYQPNEDIVIQSYNDSSTKKGGLEMVKLDDSEIADDCSGTDTSLSFIQNYFMKKGTIQLDSIVTNMMHKSYHNFVNQSQGNLTETTGCLLTNPNVHYNPVISLGNEIVICKGSSRQLTAGLGYTQYLWSDGSTAPSIFINNTGKYWVSVTDQNGCKGSDTTSVVAMVSPPVAFLPPDTAACLQGNLTIIPFGTYQEYRWSDFSNGRSLTVSQPGLYWLQVTDSNNCIGIDSMQVNQAPCFNEMVVPNAFTPNGDGLNDLFKPLLSGNVTKFLFTVYNRWGEKVFETKSLRQGWDGKLNNVRARNGIFVWYCEYQLAGQATKIKKGTVMLIR
jgi:gliding motility-associated-like protein